MLSSVLKRAAIVLSSSLCFLLLSGCDNTKEEKAADHKEALVDGSHGKKNKKSKTKKKVDKGSKSSSKKRKKDGDSDGMDVDKDSVIDLLAADASAENQAAADTSEQHDVAKEEDGPEHGEKAATKQEDSKKTASDKTPAKEQAQQQGELPGDKGVVQRKMQELQGLSHETMPKWIEANAATIIMRSRVFGQTWKKLTKAQQNEITKTWAKFISMNVSSFLPMIKGLSVSKVDCAKAGQKIKKFTAEMVETSTQKVSTAIILSTNNLRIIDIIAQDVSLLSILKTAATDILNQKGDKIKNWRAFLNKSAVENGRKDNKK
ncbi:MAG: ABC transporter substrate-binding protein [Holosporales bacterium]|jgi:ABC-type transporter MlaC component|nr:ABC transporter substrate-binding protein [Holosporales bacterium]